MKKIIIVGVITFAVGVIISPVAGMAISSTRSLILGMAPDEAILTLADKIDEESGRNDQQEQKIIELDNINKQQEEARQQKADEARQEQIAQCEKRKLECPGKIEALNDKINEVERQIDRDKAEIKKCNESSCKMGNDNRKGMIADAEAIISKSKTSLSDILNNECKDYKNQCE